jgi:predicted nuclease with TOPRIM domain
MGLSDQIVMASANPATDAQVAAPAAETRSVNDLLKAGLERITDPAERSAWESRYSEIVSAGETEKEKAAKLAEQVEKHKAELEAAKSQIQEKDVSLEIVEDQLDQWRDVYGKQLTDKYHLSKETCSKALRSEGKEPILRMVDRMVSASLKRARDDGDYHQNTEKVVRTAVDMDAALARGDKLLGAEQVAAPVPEMAAAAAAPMEEEESSILKDSIVTASDNGKGKAKMSTQDALERAFADSYEA